MVDTNYPLIFLKLLTWRVRDEAHIKMPHIEAYIYTHRKWCPSWQLVSCFSLELAATGAGCSLLCCSGITGSILWGQHPPSGLCVPMGTLYSSTPHSSHGRHPVWGLEIPSRCHQRVPAPPRALLGPAGAASTQTRAVLAEHPCTTACKTFHFSPLTPSAPLWLCSVAFAAGESGQRGFLLDLNGLEMLHPVWKRTSGFVPSHGGEQQGILSHHLCS